MKRDGMEWKGMDHEQEERRKGVAARPEAVTSRGDTETHDKTRTFGAARRV